MKSTQDHLTITDIKDDIVLLKSGGAALILQTTAVNFDLLSEMEQVAIIQSFAQMLNSLSFPIQIVIRSKKLDIINYLQLLDMAFSRQTNPLLANLMSKYRQFIQSLIRQNEVLDKHFFISLPLSNLEIGIFSTKREEALKKAQTILLPRKEQISKQLGRVGLKVLQLNTKALVELFYDIYNPPMERVRQPLATISQMANNQPQVPVKPEPQPEQLSGTLISRPARQHPFVVEELMDTI